MLKREIVYREMLETKGRLTQLEFAKTLGFSLSTVNNALRPLVAMGAVAVLRRGFKIRDKEKILLFWASVRNLRKDIIYETRVDASPNDIEKSMPSDVVYTAYSAYKLKFHSVPADYSEIYVYSSQLTEIKKRFPHAKGPTNLFVLNVDSRLFQISRENIAPLSQVFVDLWNLKEWYAKEYIKELKEKIL